ncbi:hypothetical protein KNP414_04304 [Paenibacillus mucilaginosus KNP414]|uniref:Uncharacterized protein n=1 Tax=Paenibacillus mucilaginosus (strain KNP414) TaxID=1036673 RepID=F8FJI6_PAEMK|nr:hypothetical protein KNP414_04304 [Paenibacillus mucilaginosus KNP414]
MEHFYHPPLDTVVRSSAGSSVRYAGPFHPIPFFSSLQILNFLKKDGTGVLVS